MKKYLKLLAISILFFQYFTFATEKNKKISCSPDIKGLRIEIVKQKINYMVEDQGLYRKLTISAFGSFSQNNSSFTLKPRAIASIQGPNSYILFGSGYDVMLKGNSIHTGYHQRTSIELGTYFRVKDALILNAIFHMSGLSVGASFDLNVSSLNSATGGFGAMEFYLAYKFQKARGLGAPSIH